MEKHLKSIAKSYDEAIDLGRKGLPDQYSTLPKYIIDDKNYDRYNSIKNNRVGSESKLLKRYLSPKRNMKFVDLGCCLNLMLKGYEKWKSLYYGVDISEKTIELLKQHIVQNSIKVGDLICGGIHDTPFRDNEFDIGACIGVLEYFDKEYVEKSLKEIHRILKPNAKLVLDIPNTEGKMGRVMMSIENYIGRTDKFEMNTKVFETLLEKYFIIKKRDKISDKIAMIKYYLIKK